MELKFFLVFIGLLLACSILLTVVVKSLAEGIALGGKKPYLYGFGGGILTALAAFGASFFSTNPLEHFWILGGIYCLFGIMHMLFIHNRFFYSNKDKSNSNRVLMGELIFGLCVILFTIVVFSALQYFFKDRDFLFYPIVMNTLLFFVPMLIFHSFHAAYEIPPAKFPTWYYPLNKPVVPRAIYDTEPELIIGFEVAEKALDSEKNYFRVRATETGKLSTLFYDFINEYNDPEEKTTIEFIDKENDPYEWWFYVRRKWYQTRKILNPEFSIRESGIKENTVIICERILNTTPVSKHIKKGYYER